MNKTGNYYFQSIYSQYIDVCSRKCIFYFKMKDNRETKICISLHVNAKQADRF